MQYSQHQQQDANCLVGNAAWHLPLTRLGITSIKHVDQLAYSAGLFPKQLLFGHMTCTGLTWRRAEIRADETIPASSLTFNYLQNRENPMATCTVHDMSFVCLDNCQLNQNTNRTSKFCVILKLKCL
jgi:hypothetical protein